MPKVHTGTTALKNVKAQVCSQAHYANRKIPIDFSGLHSLPKFGLESLPAHSYRASLLTLQPQTRTACPGNGSGLKNQDGKSRKQNMRDEQGKRVDTRNMLHGLHLLSSKGGKDFPKIRCLNLYLNISQIPERQHWQMLSFENIGQCCPASFGGRRVWNSHRKREDKDASPGVTGVF